MVWCQVVLNLWDLRRPPLFILLTWVVFRGFVKRDHLGLFAAVFSGESVAGDCPCTWLPAVCAFLSRCLSEHRKHQLLISCLLNHRPADRAAHVTSLFSEESPMAIVFHPENKHTRLSAVLHFSETIVVVTVTCYHVWCQGQRWVLCKYYCLVEFSQDLCKSCFLEEEIWSQRTAPLPEVAQVWAQLAPCLCSLLQLLRNVLILTTCLWLIDHVLWHRNLYFS